MSSKTDSRISLKDYETDRLLQLLAYAPNDSINRGLTKKLNKLAIRDTINTGAINPFTSVLEGAAMMDSKPIAGQPTDPALDSILALALAGEASQEQKDYYFKKTGFRLS